MSTLGPVACVNVSKDKQLSSFPPRREQLARAQILRLRRSTRRSRIRPIRAQIGLGLTNQEAGQAKRNLCPNQRQKTQKSWVAQSVGSAAPSWPFQTGQALVGKCCG